MLNAANINLIAVAAHRQGLGHFTNIDGHIIALFIITIAAAEVGLAMAIILRIFRNRGTVDVSQMNVMKW